MMRYDNPFMNNADEMDPSYVYPMPYINPMMFNMMNPYMNMMNPYMNMMNPNMMGQNMNMNMMGMDENAQQNMQNMNPMMFMNPYMLMMMQSMMGGMPAMMPPMGSSQMSAYIKKTNMEEFDEEEF